MRCITAVFLLATFLHFHGVAACGHAQTGEAAVSGARSADGNGVQSQKSPALTGVRRPLYRLHTSDVIEIRFTFTPEYDQTVTLQPDGYLMLRDAGSIFAEGLTLSDLREDICKAYSVFLHEPEVSVLLRDFEKPFFIAGGQVGRPGKYELRSTTTVAQAVALAGGFNDQAKHSQVVLFRKQTDGVVEAHVLNMKSMLASRKLDEDIELKPGDMLFVPQNRISKIRKYLPTSTLSTFFTPAQF
jgi:polysaccharide biosynthesis/export protein